MVQLTLPQVIALSTRCSMGAPNGSMREANRRGEDLGLTEEEFAFYDALEVNDSAVKVLGDETLRTIARELVVSIKRNLTIDWTIKESVRANLRATVKRLLRRSELAPVSGATQLARKCDRRGAWESSDGG